MARADVRPERCTAQVKPQEADPPRPALRALPSTLPAHKGRMDNALGARAPPSAFAHLQGRVIAGHGLRERDVHVEKGRARTRKRAVCDVVHDAPSFGVTRMPRG